MRLSSWMAGLLAVVFTIGLLLHPMSAQPQPLRMRQYVYIVRLVPRLHVEKAWTDQDKQAVMRHFERLKSAGERGPVVQAGRTEEPADKTFGIVIFEAPDEPSARAFMENDPAVKAGVMTAELHPYLVAVQRNSNPEK